MSLASVRAFLSVHAPDLTIVTHESPTSTVALAAAAHGVAQGQIAKTLCLTSSGKAFLLVTAGDARLDNAKARAVFGGKVGMPGAEEVMALTGHPVGGVCPFGLPTGIPVHCDVSLRRFSEVVPAAGDTHSAVRIGTERLAALTGATWVDVCRLPDG